MEQARPASCEVPAGFLLVVGVHPNLLLAVQPRQKEGDSHAVAHQPEVRSLQEAEVLPMLLFLSHHPLPSNIL